MEGKSHGSSHNHEGEGVVIEDSKGKPMIGDIIWVKLSSGSWWPALVVGFNSSQRDEDSDTLSEDVRVRLYGSFEHLLVDPTKWLSKFQITLNENNGSCQEIFRKALEQDMARSKSSQRRGKQLKSQGTSNAKARGSSRKQAKHDEVKRKLKVDSPNRGGDSKRISSKKDRIRKKHNGVTQNEDGEVSGRSPELSARRIKVMQILGLAAPSGSPFHY